MSGTPRTYDEITARTVPDPDSSFRPTQEQQREALSRVEPPRDEVLALKVEEALTEVNGSDLSFEIDGNRVVLHGAVVDMPTWRRIDAALRAIDGVQLDNRTHVR
jgi:hypothetical protein